MNQIELKEFLDYKANKYESVNFIDKDPIKIPHQFSLKEDIEISGFLVASIAWGNRLSILNSATKMMDLMEGSPYDFIMNHRSLSEKGYFLRGNRSMLSLEFSERIIYKEDQNKIGFLKFIRLMLNKDINRILPVMRFPNYPFRKLNKKKWQGAKTCNLGVWKSDFESINGYDENYEGWGREDSDFVVRLINNNILRKEAIFSTGLLHLKHEIISRENFSKNDKLLKQAINNKKTYINNGYKKS